MSCKSLLVLGALMFATVRANAVAPSPAFPAPPPPPPDAACEVPPAQAAYTMTIYNGPCVVQKTWVAENGSWRSYRAVPDCPPPCGTSAPACAAQAPCAPRPYVTYTPPCSVQAPRGRHHCS